MGDVGEPMGDVWEPKGWKKMMGLRIQRGVYEQGRERNDFPNFGAGEVVYVYL